MKDFKIILGRNSTDRQERMLQKVKAFASASKGEKALFIVPDQYTFSAEKYLISELGDALMHRVRVISFKHLAQIVFSQCGTSFDFVGEGGRAALMLNAYSAVQPQLSYYADYSDFNFNDALCNQIKTFKAYGLKPQTLLDAETSDSVKDLALIYGSYDALLGKTFADPADRLSILSDVIIENGLFQDTYVFVDYFKILNAAELGVLKALYEVGAHITLSLVCEGYADDTDVFYSVSTVLKNIEKYIKRVDGSLVIEKAEEKNNYKFPALSHIEKNLYSEENVTIADTEGVNLYIASDISDEVDRVCCYICELVRDRGFEYSDIAVVVRNEDEYAADIDSTFSEYGIPVILHGKNSILGKRAVRFVSSLFACLRFGFKREDVLDFINCGYLKDIDSDDIGEFERYIRIWNCRGKDYEKPFVRSINGFTGGAKGDSEKDKNILERVEKVRSEFWEIASFLGKPSHKDRVRNFAENLFELFQKLNIENEIAKQTQIYAQYNDKLLAEENDRVYELMIRGLDEYVSVSGDDEVSLEDFGRMYLRILSEYSLGSIPTVLDGVLVGNADTVPLLNPKAVFVLGLTEGNFPARCNASGLVSDKDRKVLEEQGIIADSSPLEKFLYEEFIVYFVMSSAREFLFISYPTISRGENVPSAPFERVRALFENYKPESAPNEENGFVEKRIQSKTPARYRALRDNIKDLKDYFEITEEFGNAEIPEEFQISEDTAKALYKLPLRLSASRSDTYFSCPYKYFVRYGLGLNPLEKAEFSPVNTGTIIHDSLDCIFKAEKDIAALDNISILNLATKTVDEYMNKSFGEESESPEIKRKSLSVKKRLESLLRTMRDELKISQFKPVYTEFGIGKEGGMPVYEIREDGVCADITGSIDRVDEYFDGENSYVRVIDYKTGSKKFSLNSIYQGLDMQMILYLSNLAKDGRSFFSGTVKPAGAIYYLLNKETEKSDNVSESLKGFEEGEYISSSENKINPRSGVLLEDFEILEKMDSTGKYLPPKGKDGVNRIDEHGFEILFDYTQKRLLKMCRGITSGIIPKTSFKFGGKESCSYCPIEKYCENKNCYHFEKENYKDVLTKMEEESDDE